MKKTTEDVIKFNKDFPAPPGVNRRSLECHCGNAFVVETTEPGPGKVVFGEDCNHEHFVVIYPVQQEGYECNDKLAELLNLLRSAQRSFFAAPAGSNPKFVALAESKRLEKELDKFLQDRNQPKPQPDLFNS